MVVKKIIKNKYFLFFIMTLLSSCILMCKDLFLGDDLNFHLSRIVFVKENIMNGNIFSGLYYFLGYGYGEGFFYPDFFLTIPAVFLILTNNIVVSYKLFLVIINLCSIISAYYSVLIITKSKKNALIIAFIYALLPYRLCTMYYRASLGESIAFIFFPLVISGFYELFKKGISKWYLLVIGMSGLILSHLLSAILIFIALIPLTLINVKKINKEVLKKILKSILLTVLLTAFFIFPMIEQLSISKFKFFCAGLDSPLNEKALGIFSVFNEYNNIPPGIGIILTISILIFIINYKKVSNNTKVLYLLGIFILLLTTNIFPWRILNKYLRIIQFPWRIMPIAILILLAGLSSMLKELKISKRKYSIMSITIVILSFISLLNCFTSLNLGKTSVAKYYIAWGEYLPYEFDEFEMLDKRKEGIYTQYYIKPNSFIVKKKNQLDYTVTFANNQYIIDFKNNFSNNTLKLPIIYYKGYIGYVNDKKTNIYKTKDGYVGIKVSNESGQIRVYYKNTIIQIISRIVSLMALIILIIILFSKKQKNKK